MGQINRVFCVVVTLLLTVGVAAAADDGIDAGKLPITIESYDAEVNPRTGEAVAGGYKIVHQDYDVELEDRIVKVPILAIQYTGLQYASVEARAKCIAERLVHALDLMETGGELFIMRDDWNAWRQGASSEAAYAVYVSHSSLPTAPLRIITLHRKDVQRFPFVGTSMEMAEYVKAIIEAHHMLFWKRSVDINEYEMLKVDQTREGKIFKELFIRGRERAREYKRPDLNVKDIKDALGRVALSQRQRLVNMAVTAPRDWIEDTQ